jgi:hypothetical protein
MSNERKQTIRQEIISHLENGPLTVRDISQSVGIMEKDVYHHLASIEKTVRHQKKRIHVEPWSPIIAWIADFNLRTGRHSRNQVSARGAKMAE